MQKNKGITLIALVITIIILLILAGITVGALTGENGLFKRAIDARDNTLLAQQEEQNMLNYLEENMDNWISGTVDSSSGLTPQERVEAKGWDTDIIEDVIDGAPIPQGFTVDTNNQTVADGLVIIDINDNEFVWIPCTPGQYVKWDGSVTGLSYVDTKDDTIPTAVTGWGQTEESQITKYRGFYIARYTAGMPTSFTANPANTANRNKAGKPLSQKNQIQWNYIDYTNAKKNAESMISMSNVQSGLVTGRMYDRVMKWLEDKGYNVQTDSRAWGNYLDAPVTGITQYSTDNGGTWTTTASTTKGTSTSWLLKTGHTDYTKAKNIYDLAGSSHEWTNERAISYSDPIERGGPSSASGLTASAARRSSNVVTNALATGGFRTRHLSVLTLESTGRLRDAPAVQSLMTGRWASDFLVSPNEEISVSLLGRLILLVATFLPILSDSYVKIISEFCCY